MGWWWGSKVWIMGFWNMGMPLLVTACTSCTWGLNWDWLDLSTWPRWLGCEPLDCDMFVFITVFMFLYSTCTLLLGARDWLAPPLRLGAPWRLPAWLPWLMLLGCGWSMWLFEGCLAA